MGNGCVHVRLYISRMAVNQNSSWHFRFCEWFQRHTNTRGKRGREKKNKGTKFKPLFLEFCLFVWQQRSKQISPSPLKMPKVIRRWENGISILYIWTNSMDIAPRVTISGMRVKQRVERKSSLRHAFWCTIKMNCIGGNTFALTSMIQRKTHIHSQNKYQ